MEHAHDELASAAARTGLVNGGGQPRRASVPLPEPRSGLQPAAEPFSSDDGLDDDMPALIMGSPLSPVSWARPPPHSAHGSPTRPRRTRVSSAPLSSATTFWVSPETYWLSGRARGTGVSPHASAADNGTAPADGEPDVVEFTVGYDFDSPSALGGSRDNPIGVVPYEPSPRPLIVDSLERVSADCLHRFDALQKDGKALCYICHDSLLEHPLLEDASDPAEEPSSSEARPPVVRAFPCRHLFHELCLAPWLQAHTTCPTCRFDAASSGLDDEEDDVDVDAIDDGGVSGGTIGRLIGAIHDLQLSTSPVSLDDASAPSGPTIRLDQQVRDAIEAGYVALSPPSTPTPFTPNWNFPIPPSRPQTPPNTLRPTPEDYRTPSVSPQLPFRPRTPVQASSSSFPTRLNDRQTELLEQMALRPPSPDGPLGTIYIPDDQLPESVLPEFPFEQFEEGETTLREALSGSYLDLQVDLSSGLLSPEDLAPFIVPGPSDRRRSAIPSMEPEPWVHVHQRRASVPVAAVQPDKPFAEWLEERERDTQ